MLTRVGMLSSALRVNGFAQSGAQLFGDHPAIRRRTPAQNDPEFLATIAAKQVRMADDAAEDAGDMPEHLVAHQVAVGVVDPLEVIEVEHQEAERLAVPSGEGNRMLQLGHQRGVVARARQAVTVHQLPDATAAFGPRQDHLQQVASLDRLGEKVVAAGAQPFHFVGEGSARRQEDDRHQREPRILAHQAGDGVAIDIGKFDVEQHQVRHFGREDIASHLGAVADPHSRVDLPEPCRQQLGLGGIVLHNDHVRGRRTDLGKGLGVLGQPFGSDELPKTASTPAAAVRSRSSRSCGSASTTARGRSAVADDQNRTRESGSMLRSVASTTRSGRSEGDRSQGSIS